MKRKLVLVLMVILLLLGVAIMLYPTVSSLINARNQSQVIGSYQESVAQFTEEEIAAFFAEAEAYNERLRKSSIVLTDPFDETARRVILEGYSDLLNVNGDGVMGYVDMNIQERDIRIHLPIYHGTSQTVLARAVGHLEGTSLPVGGEGTHSVLSAHNGLASAKLFDDLEKLKGIADNDLKEYDTFTITVLDEVLTYRIYSVEVVEPDDISSLGIRDGEDQVTLVTCTPYAINSHRLLVHGTRILTPEETVEEEPVTVLQTVPFSWRYLAIGGAVALFAILALILIIRRGRKRRRIRELWRQIRG